MDELGVLQLQTVDMPDSAERKAFGKLMAKSGVLLTYCATRVLNGAGLSLSDLDAGRREQAVLAVCRQMCHAQEAGAMALDVISGPRPAAGGEPARQNALKALEESLYRIAAYGRKNAPKVALRIEPLDKETHKKQTLGTAEEAVALASRIQKMGESLRLCLDTAHMYLNGEYIAGALATAAPWVNEFHLCNACGDPGHALYGDQHIAPGRPGAFDTEAYAGFISVLEQYCPEAQVFTEYLVSQGGDGRRQAQSHVEILTAAGVAMRRG